MRPTTAASTLALLSTTQAALPLLSIAKRDSNLQYTPNAILRRDGGTVETNIFDILSYSTGGAYYANVTVGTPPQDQVVILDTGSSDLYFDASTAQACESTGPYSCRGGTFEPKNSSTYFIVDPAPAFNTSFGDGSTAMGPFSEDVVGIGNVLIQNVQFGVAEKVNSTTGYAIGLMGLGYSENEAVQQHFYPNMPEVLRDTGVINSRLYSVYLNDVGAYTGTILFGGIDTTKYTGEIATLDLLPDINTGVVDQFIQTVTGLAYNNSGKATNLFYGGSPNVQAYTSTDVALPVLLDTGSSAWSVPTSYYDKFIAPQFTFVDPQSGLCACSHQNDDTSLILEFGAKLNITVPIREFVVPVYNSSSNEPYIVNGQSQCAFMIVPAQPTGQGFQTLGDAILRSMYIVFDLDQGQVSLAQAKVNGSSSPNVVTVSAGPSGIANAISTSYSAAPVNTNSIAPAVQNATASFSVSTAQSTIGSATGVGAVPADAQVSGGASGTASSSGSKSSGSSSKGAAAGLVVPGADFSGVWVVGVSVAMAALGAGLVL
ncbi:hypothetical protein LTR62_004841 [Meristemomyces frigidus]|uniref:Peptidase A1 domain-containing protein n=1 Tax=Meristemomyces frigidus TaxID=1508187 RepID=A0AAN7YJN1_9PEZI|nr:hypothetical protein LTR62_004841 [Meristemomyces frigidus]